MRSTSCAAARQLADRGELDAIRERLDGLAPATRSTSCAAGSTTWPTVASSTRSASGSTASPRSHALDELRGRLDGVDALQERIGALEYGGADREQLERLARTPSPPARPSTSCATASRPPKPLPPPPASGPTRARPRPRRPAARPARRTERIAEVDRGAGSVLAEVKATGDRLEEVAGLARAAHEAAGDSRAEQDELRAAMARLGGEVQVAREGLEQATEEALGARQQAATASEAATAAREDAGRAREDAQVLRRELGAGRERLETAADDIARLGRELGTVRAEAAAAAADAARGAQDRLAAVDQTFTLMRADLGVNREQLETLKSGVEKLAGDVAAGRTEAEGRAGELLAELAAVRAIAEEAGAGVAELRAELAAGREEIAAVREQAELANAVAEHARATAEAAKLDEEKVAALQAETQFALSTMEEMKAGLTSAGQAALVARREAEQAKKAAEHAGDGTGEHVTAVFREILGLAAKGRPKTLHKAVDEDRRQSRASPATASTTSPSRWP